MKRGDPKNGIAVHAHESSHAIDWRPKSEAVLPEFGKEVGQGTSSVRIVERPDPG